MSSTAMSLVQAVEARGGKLFVEGEYLVIEPAEAGEPLIGDLRKYKQEIIVLIQTREMPALPENMPALPSGVKLVAFAPKSAPVQISQSSTVTNVEKFIHCTLRQLSARLSGQSWQSGNWSLSTLLDRLARCGCVVELDDPRKAMQ